MKLQIFLAAAVTVVASQPFLFAQNPAEKTVEKTEAGAKSVGKGAKKAGEATASGTEKGAKTAVKDAGKGLEKTGKALEGK